MTNTAGEHPFPPLPPGLPASVPVVFGGHDGTVLDSFSANALDDAHHSAGVAGASSPDLSLGGLGPSPSGDVTPEPPVWGLLSEASHQPEDQYLADDEQDWYSEVREDEGTATQGLVHISDSEEQGWHDPYEASEASAVHSRAGRFYMKGLASFEAAPKILEPMNERDDFRRLAVELSAKRRRKNIPKLPWETGTLNLVFSKSSVLGERDWTCSGVLLNAAATETHDAEMPLGVAPEELGRVTAAFGRKLMRMKAPASEEQIRAAALKRLKVLVCLDPTASKLGMSLLDHLHNLCDDDVIIRSISDAFRAKASQTLIKRAGSLERFARWSFDHESPSPFRAGEQDLYEYLCFLRSDGAKPTSANHFLQAWRFLHGTIVLIYSPPAEVISTRCEGAARDQYLTKAPLKQKSPLSRAQVEELERRAVESSDTKLVCVLGQLLFCLHASCRWSDSQWIVVISRQEADGVVLLVVDALTAKHTYSQESQRILLPYAALGKGLSGLDWADAWLKAREAEGLAKLEG